MNCVVASQEFYQDGNGPENVGVYNLSKGVNRFCLSKPGNSSKMLVLKMKKNQSTSTAGNLKKKKKSVVVSERHCFIYICI